MFTGIVSDVGQVIEMTPHGELCRLVVASVYDPASVALGASVAAAGVCLTAVGVEAVNGGAAIAFDVGVETLAVTTWGERKPDDRVNLEVDQMARYAARLIEAGGTK